MVEGEAQREAEAARDLYEDALRYHATGRRGKIEVRSTKPTRTQRDLSLAYSPGVAEPCRRIHEDPEASFDYTARGNLVAVISDGSAVLGLGDIGPAASKPVMEGKGVLFKRFADIDVFDLEVDSRDPDHFIDVVRALAPGFGGINLEDIKAPDCYHIEETLRRELDIPVFHDDQHGTAIIASAALLNSLDLVGKTLREVRVVFSGAGAAAISCARLFVSLGVERSNVLVVDSKGVIHSERDRLSPQKEEFRAETDRRSLADAMRGADVFVGLSKGGVVSAEMVQSMAERPIVFALANPDPEIDYDVARRACPDAIVGTGRSDFPNQINNVLGFPFIFRGALDVRAREINEAMKLAAVRALAELAREDVPESVSKVYGSRPFEFGADYVIPKPFDRRALVRVSSAVAEAAIESGVARAKLDIDDYRLQLENRLGRSSKIMRTIFSDVQRGAHCRIVFPEGECPEIVEASLRILQEGVGKPILLGDEEKIRSRIRSLAGSEKVAEVALSEIEVVDPLLDVRRAHFAEELYRLRKYKGLRREEAAARIEQPLVFGAMMVKLDEAECCLAGVTQSYADTIRPALEIIRVQDWLSRVAGLYIVTVGERALFFADTTINIDPSPSELAEIAICAAEAARQFGAEPRVAMLSFSNAGEERGGEDMDRASTLPPGVDKVRQAVAIARERFPDLEIEGEISADAALSEDSRDALFPDARLSANANVLVFPDLEAANIAYRLMLSVGGGEGFGPIILGMRKPVNVLAQGSSVEDIVNMAAITVRRAQADGAR